MPRKSKSKPNNASKELKNHRPHNDSSSSRPSTKRRKLNHQDDSSPNNPESAQAPSEPLELESPVATLKSNIIARAARASHPPPPPSVPSTFILSPPEADDPAIREKWNIHTTSLGGAGAKIESKVRQVLNAFKPSMPPQHYEDDASRAGIDKSSAEASDEPPKKGILVALTARAPAGNKSISVAEIVKRDMLANGVSVIWQYTGCWTRLETYVPPKPKDARNSTPDKDKDDTEITNDITMEEEGEKEEEESAFETMQIEERTLVRNAVCLVIYLALEPIPSLKELYGEQVFRPEVKEKT